jgi:hypothetical protein
MDRSDIDRAQAEVGVKLPGPYIEFLLRRPAKFNGPECQKALIGDDDRLIQVNRRARQYNQRYRSKKKPWEWPAHLFVVGETDNLALTNDFKEEKCCYTIDVRKKDINVQRMSMISGIQGVLTPLMESAEEMRQQDAAAAEDAAEKAARKAARAAKAAQKTRPAPAAKKPSLTAKQVFALRDDPEPFWKTLWEWTTQRWERRKHLSKLTEGEQMLWRLKWMESEVNGDGWAQWFGFAEDGWPQLMLGDLREMGAVESAKALEQIGAVLFPGGAVPESRAERHAAMERDIPESVETQCDRIWKKAGGGGAIAPLLRAYVVDHPELFGA